MGTPPLWKKNPTYLKGPRLRTKDWSLRTTFQAAKETIIATGGNPAGGNCATNAAEFNGDGKLDIAHLSSNPTINIPHW
jgi:hypothetical protein